MNTSRTVAALFAILANCGLSLAQSQSPDQTAGSMRRVALVIGNSNYKNGQSLCNPLKDASKVAGTFQRMGFDVEHIENAGLVSMQDAITRFRARIQPGDFAVFYFSGHGAQVFQQNFLIPTDYLGNSPTDLLHHAYQAENILKIIDDKHPRIRILILDACSNNPYSDAKGGTRGLNTMTGSEGTLIAFAASPGQVALDRCGEPNGLYTGVLLKHLENPSLKIPDVFAKTKEEVARVSAGMQFPWVSDGFIDRGTSFWAAPGIVPSGLDSNARILLKLAGSNTIGEQAAVRLAEGYLKQKGARDIRRVPGAPGEVQVTGLLNGALVAIDIKSHGSKTGFDAIGTGAADIAMSSVEISRADYTGSLRNEADMTSSLNQYRIGRDSISVIVHRENQIWSLTRPQLRAIFSGRIRNWNELLDVKSQPIKVYALDDNSGTARIFKDLVMEGEPISKDAIRLEEHSQLSGKVASDRSAVGFVGYPYVESARAVRVGNGIAAPQFPGRSVVATKDYLLIRDLFLYVPSNRSKEAGEFLTYAESDEGQRIMETCGFVGKHIPLLSDRPTPGGTYGEFVQGAKSLDMTFRYERDSADLSAESRKELDKLIAYLRKLDPGQYEILLAGHADIDGTDLQNDQISLQRAQQLATRLRVPGVIPRVRGFGRRYPAADSATAEGKQLSRRVEVWIRPRAARQ